MEAPNIGPDKMLKRRRARKDPLLESDEWGIFDEAYFHQMLDLERKRCERSGKPALLMLLDVREACGDVRSSMYLQSMGRMLAATSRETDIKGWYQDQFLVGVIYTEMGETDINLARDKIRRKTLEMMGLYLDPSVARKIGVSFQVIAPVECSGLASDSLIRLHPGKEKLVEQKASRSLLGFLGSFFCQRWFLLAGDILLISLAYEAAVWTRSGDPVEGAVHHVGIYLLSLLLFPVLLYVFDMYNAEKGFGFFNSVFRTGVAVPVFGGMACSLLYLVAQGQYNRFVIVLHLLAAWGAISLWRLLYDLLFQKSASRKRVLVLGSGESAVELDRLLASPSSPYQIDGFLNGSTQGRIHSVNGSGLLGRLEDLTEIAHGRGVKAAILAIPRNRPFWLTRKILEARLSGLEIIEMATVYEEVSGRIPVEHIEDQWLLFSEGFHVLSKEYVRKIKRVIDFVAASMIMIAAFPVMLLAALAIKLDSRGPIFYSQERVGKGNEIFKVYKFRSMTTNAEAQGAQWALKKDPRVTRVGHWIRVFRIDELPQLWNIFKGDMSLVGPRPERPVFVDELESKIPYYGVRHVVRPGITGWAQVKYPYGASLEDALRKLEYDLYYIKNTSILLDLKIILRTVGVVVLGEGAR